jgi:hypothetical protein
MLQIYESCNHFIRTVPALILDENNIEDVETDGEDHTYDEACHIMMHRPVRGTAAKQEIRRPPDISEVARLERAEIYAQARDEYDNENALYEW